MNIHLIRIHCNLSCRRIGTILLTCACALLFFTEARAQIPYIHTATSSTIHGDWTDLSVKDSSTGSIYFVTSNWNPPGSTGKYYNHPLGVWYDDSHKDWAIFSQDATAMVTGAAFNVLQVPAYDNAYVHIATKSNSASNWTLLDNPYSNNNPHALVWATPNWNPNDRVGIYNNHNIGVWYTGSKWAIFNQDGSPIPVGAAFNVVIAYGPFYPEVYAHTAASSNITGNWTYLNDWLINGSNGHIVMVTPNWNPNGVGGVYNNHPIGVWYDANKKQYGIFNQDLAAMKVGTSFNVWVWK